MGNAPGALDTRKNSVHTVELICLRKVWKVAVVATWWWWSWLTVAGARAAPTKRNVSSIKINYKGRTVHTVQGGWGVAQKLKGATGQ